MAFAMIILLLVITEAKTHSYQSTYNMTGGVFSNSYYSPTSYITTTIRPKIGTSGCNMGIIWGKKYWYGWDGDIDYVSSTEGGSVTFNVNDKRRLWLRNFSGNRWTGNVTLTWD